MMNIIKSYEFVIVIIFFTITSSFGQTIDHESLPYQIFFINNTNSSIFMLTSNIDFNSKTLEILYLPKNNSNDTIVHINVGEIIGDFENLKVLDSIEIKPQSLKDGEKFKRTIVPIHNVDKGIKIVLWEEKGNSGNLKNIPFDKSSILERAGAISSEQTRLALFGINTNSKELFIEVCRNQEE